MFIWVLWGTVDQAAVIVELRLDPSSSRYTEDAYLNLEIEGYKRYSMGIQAHSPTSDSTASSSASFGLSSSGSGSIGHSFSTPRKKISVSTDYNQYYSGQVTEEKVNIMFDVNLWLAEKGDTYVYWAAFLIKTNTKEFDAKLYLKGDFWYLYEIFPLPKIPREESISETIYIHSEYNAPASPPGDPCAGLPPGTPC